MQDGLAVRTGEDEYRFIHRNGSFDVGVPPGHKLRWPSSNAWTLEAGSEYLCRLRDGRSLEMKGVPGCPGAWESDGRLLLLHSNNSDSIRIDSWDFESGSSSWRRIGEYASVSVSPSVLRSTSEGLVLGHRTDVSYFDLNSSAFRTLWSDRESLRECITRVHTRQCPESDRALEFVLGTEPGYGGLEIFHYRVDDASIGIGSRVLLSTFELSIPNHLVFDALWCGTHALGVVQSEAGLDVISLAKAKESVRIRGRDVDWGGAGPVRRELLIEEFDAACMEGRLMKFGRDTDLFAFADSCGHLVILRLRYRGEM